MKNAFLLLISLAAATLLTACASIPNGGFHGDLSTAGRAGALIETVQISEGMLVQTISLDADREINLQINDDETEDDPLLYEHILTIGKFSTLLGSGFAKKENIYYEKRIPSEGKDFFNVNDKTYLVEWKCDYRDARTYVLSDHYTVKVSEFTPHKSDATTVTGDDTPE